MAGFLWPQNGSLGGIYAKVTIGSVDMSKWSRRNSASNATPRDMLLSLEALSLEVTNHKSANPNEDPFDLPLLGGFEEDDDHTEDACPTYFVPADPVPDYRLSQDPCSTVVQGGKNNEASVGTFIYFFSDSNILKRFWILI